jgi:cytochrome c oxidase subunit 4
MCPGLARPVFSDVFYPDRNHWAVLAFCRYRVDFLVSTVVSDWTALMASPRVPVKVFYQIFGLLLALTGLTVGVAYLNLGPLNSVLALTIATGKALCVLLYFMHLRWSSHLTWLFLAVGLLWLLLLIAFPLADVFSRSWLGVPQGWEAIE